MPKCLSASDVERSKDLRMSRVYSYAILALWYRIYQLDWHGRLTIGGYLQMFDLVDRAMAILVRFNLRGWSRIYSLILGSRLLRVRTQDGLNMHLSPHEYIDNLVLRTGYYEREVLESILDALQEGQVFWDVGANIGLHSLTSKLIRPDITVIAFEPNPEMVERIDIARRENGLDIDIARYALGRSNETAQLWIHPGNLGMSSLTNWHSAPPEHSIACKVCTGEGAIELGAPMPNVLKIDVEGNELSVLEGMGDLILCHSLHTIIFEDSIHPESPAKSLLRMSGFQISQLVRQGNTAHNLENYIAKRSSH